MTDWSLALRNLLRNRRRTLATLAAIAIGAASVLLFGGFSTVIKYSMQTSYVRTGGHLQVQHRDYFLFGSADPTAYGIERYGTLIDAIKSDPELRSVVLVVTPTLQFSGVAGNYAAGASRAVLGYGLVAADHVRMREWNRFGVPLVAAPMRLAGAPPNAAVTGIGLARVLLLCDSLGIANCPSPLRARPDSDAAALPDDIAQLSAVEARSRGEGKAAEASRGRPTIELLAGTARGTPNVASLDVVAAENQGFKELDDVTVIVQLAQAQRLIFGASQPKATSIVVQLRDTSDIPRALARINEKLPGWGGGQPLVARDFGSLNPFYVQSMDLFDMIFGSIFLLISGIVMFTVSNTMNTAVVERTVEIGTLRAIGLRRRGIQRLFVSEGVLLGVLGAVAGIVVALAVAYAVNHMGLTWQPPGGTQPEAFTLAVWGETGMIAGTAGGLIAFTTLSAWWPAYRAGRLKVVDALRHA